MSKHMVKCLYCNKIFDASVENYVKPKGNRYAHLKCYEKLQSSEENYKILLEYLNQLFGNNDYNENTIRKQYRKFILEYNYSFEDILNSLKYFFEIKKNIPEPKYGIGIIPHIMVESQRYFSLLEQQSNKEVVPIDKLSSIIIKTLPQQKENKKFLQYDN